MSEITLIDKPIPYQHVIESLRGQIRDGTLSPGDKLLSTAKLAQHYDVAVPTAHRALAELVKQGYLTRKTGQGTFVRQPEESTTSTRIAAVIRCDGHVWGDFANHLLNELRELHAAATTLNVADLDYPQILTQPAFRHLMEHLPDTVIVQYTRLGEYILEASPKTHVISLESHPGHRLLDVVAPDMIEVGAMAARHLISRGYQRLGLAGIFVGEEGPYRPDFITRAMRDGLEYELHQADLPPADLIDIPAGDDASDHLAAWLASSGRAKAILCSTAHRSAQIVRLARAAGIAIPDDLAIVSALESPWAEAYDLTAINQNHASIAELCVQLIKETRDGTRGQRRHRRWYAVAPDLIVRNST